MLGQIGRLVFGLIVDVVGVPARLAAENGDAMLGVTSRHVRGNVKVQEPVVKGLPIRNGGG